MSLSEQERAKLLEQREKLEQQIKDLKAQPLGRTMAAARFRQEDLTALAKKMVAIDKKLGRVVG